MDLLTFVGWTLVIWLAYKVGVYVERRMSAKAQALQTEKDAGAGAAASPDAASTKPGSPKATTEPE